MDAAELLVWLHASCFLTHMYMHASMLHGQSAGEAFTGSYVFFWNGIVYMMKVTQSSCYM